MTSIEEIVESMQAKPGEPRQALCGLIDEPLESHLPTARHFGWSPEGTFIWASVREQDGSQHLAYRKLLASTTLGVMITGEHGATSERSKRQPEARRAFRGEFEQGRDKDGNHVFWCPDGVYGPKSPMQPMQVTRTPTTIHWDEGDILHMDGELIGGKGHFVMMPGDDEHAGMYTIYVYYATGHLGGREGTAILAFSQPWFPPGVSWFNHSWYRDIEHTWVDFGARYDDGTLEGGSIVTGSHGFNCAVIHRDGKEVVATTDVKAVINRNDDLWPDSIEYVIDGRPLTWTRRPAGEIYYPYIPGDVDAYRCAEGAVRFDDDTREHTVTTGWMDTFIDGRDGYVRPTTPAPNNPGWPGLPLPA